MAPQRVTPELVDALLARIRAGDDDGRVARPLTSVLVLDHGGESFILRQQKDLLEVLCLPRAEAQSRWRRMQRLDQFPSMAEALSGRRRAPRPWAARLV